MLLGEEVGADRASRHRFGSLAGISVAPETELACSQVSLAERSQHELAHTDHESNGIATGGRDGQSNKDVPLLANGASAREVKERTDKAIQHCVIAEEVRDHWSIE